MNYLKLLFTFLLSGILLTSCVVVNEEIDNRIFLNELVSKYDIWYVDYHRTTGNNTIPFLTKAFTVSFSNGILYANNNIVDIGKTGNGLGISIGNYNTNGSLLETQHRLDGSYGFEVMQLSPNEIRLNDVKANVSYYLIGYQRANFDYDKLFYDNIEYFLQEFKAWERVDAKNGTKNPFDTEHYLRFTSENNTTFYSSRDKFGTNIDFINWNFIGNYKIYNVQGRTDLKILTLNYNNQDNESFELSVINDETIRLYHTRSQTTYVFKGRNFVRYLRSSTTRKAVRNSERKRTKIERQTLEIN